MLNLSFIQTKRCRTYQLICLCHLCSNPNKEFCTDWGRRFTCNIKVCLKAEGGN